MTRSADNKFTPWIYHLFRRMLAVGLWWKCRLKVYGRDQIPAQGGIIIASNHASFLDPPILGVAARYRIIRFMARDTLFEHKILGWLYHRFGVVPLDRNKGDVGAIKAALRLLKEGHCVLLFPEGTRSVTGELQEAKGGVGFLIHKSGVPVVPAYINGSYKAWPKGSKKMVSHPVSVHFGAPIDPETLMIHDERGKPDFDGIGRLVMARIAVLRNLATNQTFCK